jgi:putative transposase
MAQDMGLSARKACALLDISRSVLSYELRMPAKDAPYIEALRQFSVNNHRRGYRPARVRLLKEGFVLGKEKALRLWRNAGLLVPRKRPRKRVSGSGVLSARATSLNHIWAYDFVHDMCANGQKLKCLTVIDEHSRESLAIDVSCSITSERVIAALSRLFSERDVPQYLRSDNGPEFVSQRVKEWLALQGVSLILNDPGKPWQNGYNESFNGKFRDECLCTEWFRNLREARVVIEVWRCN